MGAFSDMVMKEVVARTPVAVDKVADEILKEIRQKIQWYYGDYSPQYYSRTGAL